MPISHKVYKVVDFLPLTSLNDRGTGSHPSSSKAEVLGSRLDPLLIEVGGSQKEYRSQCKISYHMISYL